MPALQPQVFPPQNIAAKVVYSWLKANIHAGSGGIDYAFFFA
jgi:hypothetical protein